MFNKSISIPVTEDQPDEFSGKTCSCPGRKRRKSDFRGKSSDPICKQLTRRWPILLFIIALLLLLIFQASKIIWKSSTTKSRLNIHQQNPNAVVNSVKKPEGNLNRLEAPRCLKLLPPEQLQNIDLQMNKDSPVPIKKLIYMSDNDTPYDTISLHESGTTKFNLFTGYQTLNQRDQSFKVNETSCVHCGFYSDNGGFTISNEDKSYMQTCKSVVSTCAFGGGDDLYQPIGMTNTSLQKVCYVAFWDEITLTTQEKQGHIIDKDGFIGKWRVVIVKNLPFRDQRLNGKIPKMLPHRLFPNARYSIWVDSKSQFRRDPLGVFEALLWVQNPCLRFLNMGPAVTCMTRQKLLSRRTKPFQKKLKYKLLSTTMMVSPKTKDLMAKKL